VIPYRHSHAFARLLAVICTILVENGYYLFACPNLRGNQFVLVDVSYPFLDDSLRKLASATLGLETKIIQLDMRTALNYAPARLSGQRR